MKNIPSAPVVFSLMPWYSEKELVKDFADFDVFETIDHFNIVSIVYCTNSIIYYV